MNTVLLLYCHPWPHKSRYNCRLLAEARKMPGVVVRDLYELYPSLHVHEGVEQQALREADAVVLQFPIYWFSAPALMKEWMDVTLQDGFAFGEGGTALVGKKAMIAVSTGGSEISYTDGAKHGANVESFLLPFRMTAEFCGMRVEEPFVSYNVRAMSHDTINQRAQAFATRVQALVDGEKPTESGKA